MPCLIFKLCEGGVEHTAKDIKKKRALERKNGKKGKARPGSASQVCANSVIHHKLSHLEQVHCSRHLMAVVHPAQSYAFLSHEYERPRACNAARASMQ